MLLFHCCLAPAHGTAQLGRMPPFCALSPCGRVPNCFLWLGYGPTAAGGSLMKPEYLGGQVGAQPAIVWHPAAHSFSAFS